LTLKTRRTDLNSIDFLNNFSLFFVNFLETAQGGETLNIKGRFGTKKRGKKDSFSCDAKLFTMPLSPEFVQFLAEGDITVDDYNSLSTAEKISAVAKFRSSAPVQGN